MRKHKGVNADDIFRSDRHDLKKQTLISVLRNPDELFLIIRITGFLTALPVLIRVKSIQDVVRIITPEKGRVTRSPLTLDRVIYLCGRLLRIFQRHRYKYSCLKRSLLLYHFLRYYRVPVEINFGVKWGNEGLTGHSWLTLHNDLYLETKAKADQFTHFFSLPGECTDLPDYGEPPEDGFPSLKDVSFD